MGQSGLQRKMTAGRGWLLALVALAAVEGAFFHSPAQQQQGPPQPGSSQSGIPQPTSSNFPEPDPNAGKQRREAEKFAVEDRRKHMAADVDKLLQLATALKAEVDRASKDETSVSAYRKADEIERLAHDVKQRIKN